MPKASSLGYVVETGSLGGLYTRGQIVPEGRFPDDRMDMWLARGTLRPATQEDVDAANAVPTGVEALGSLDQVNFAPVALVEAERDARVAEIEALKLRIVELERANEERTAHDMELAELKEAAAERAAENVADASLKVGDKK